MSLEITLIVKSTGHSGGEHTMKKMVETGSDNERFYPSQIEHAGVGLLAWASGGMTNLIGGASRALVDHDAKIVVSQRAHLAAMEDAQKFRDSKRTQGDQVLVAADELKRLRARDALLGAMEIAGVDNWEGMDNVERPDGA